MRRTEFLENELAEAKFEIIGLSCRVTRAEDEAREFNEQNIELTKKNDKLKREIDALEILLKDKDSLIEELQEVNKELSEDNDRLVYMLDNAHEEVSTLEERLNDER